MQIVLNSSPLIFLAKLGYLNQFVESSDNFYIPQSVADEIEAKLDPASQTVQALINSDNLQVWASNFTTLVNSLNQRLGKGESEAIALGIELNADYVLLDDSTARREARRLGLNIRGTLAVIRKLSKDGRISIGSLDDLYQRLMKIGSESSGLCLIKSFLKIERNSSVPTARSNTALEPTAERSSVGLIV